MPPLFHLSIISSIHWSIYPSIKRCNALEVMVNSVLKCAGYPVCSSISIVYPSWLFFMLLLLLLLSHFSRVWLYATPWTAAHRPWDSVGKNTGVGWHFFLQCMKVKSESEVTQSCLTLCDPMDCSLPGSSIHGIFQARALEWGAIAFSASSCYTRSKNKQFVSPMVFSWIVYFDLASESF